MGGSPLCGVQFLSVAQQVGYGELSAELSRRSHDLFSPNIFLDHVGALYALVCLLSL